MKDGLEKTPTPKPSSSLGTLTPEQQTSLLKQQIGRRIKQRELGEIRKMSLSQVNDVIDKDVDPPMDGSRLNRIRLYNMKMGVTDQMMEHNLEKSPGEKHLQMLQKSEILRKYKMRQFRKDPIMAAIKRGKLGADNFFIFFGIFGSFLIPLYVFKKFKKHRQQIINSRIASPQVIRRLDENSPIDLDDVSYHTIHYYNPDRVKQQADKQKRVDQIYKLQRQLYF